MNKLIFAGLHRWNWLPVALWVFFGLLGAGVIAYATAWGPWAMTDSVAYLTVARNITNGVGWGGYQASGDFELLAHYPPFYPLALGVLGWFGLDVVTAARCMNVLLFGGLIAGAGFIFDHLTHKIWLTTSLCFVLLTSPLFLYLFTGAMSEPLFLLLGFAGLAFALIYLEQFERWMLAQAGLLCGLAFFTRYAGAAFVATGGILIVYSLIQLKRQRWFDLMLFGIASAVPMGVWWFWLRLQPQSADLRKVSLPFDGVWSALNPFRIVVVDVMWTWLPFHAWLPESSYRTRLLSLLAVALGLSALVIFSVWRRSVNIDRGAARLLRLAGLMAAFVAAYLLVLGVSYVFFSPRPDIDARMMAPAYLAILFALWALAGFFIQIWQWRGWMVIVLAGLVMLVAGIDQLPKAMQFVTEQNAHGAGYTAQGWRTSPLLQVVRDLPPGKPIISNDSSAILFWTDRPAYDIKEIVNGTRFEPFTCFGNDLSDDAQQAFRQGGALVLFEGSLYWQFDSIYYAEGPARRQAFTACLTQMASYQDGTIYFYPSEGNK